MGREDIIEAIKEDKDLSLPAEIFSHEYAPLESVVKYMKENLGYTFHQIAEMTGRDDRTIWKTYDNCRAKSSETLRIAEQGYQIPLAILNDQENSVLEIVCTYLRKTYSLSVREIAQLLNKKISTVWTVINRYRKKNG